MDALNESAPGPDFRSNRKRTCLDFRSISVPAETAIVAMNSRCRQNALEASPMATTEIFELSPLVLGTSPSVIHAFRIQSSESKLSLLGGSVVLIAREINLENPLTIDVTGAPGTGKNKEATSTQLGHDGDDGSDLGSTGNGLKGGSVLIVAERIVGSLSVIADGGRGAAGQDGQDGSPGTPGTPGRRDNTGGLGTPGGKGGKGGDAGGGGPGGNGGDGGSIAIYYIDGSRAQISMSAAVGAGGAAGQPGTVGPPGTAGPPGGGWLYHVPHGNQPPEDPTWVDAGTAGPGQPGTVRPSKPSGTPGKNVGTALSKQLRWPEMQAKVADLLPDSYWHLLLRHAEESYYNRSLDDAATVLGWMNHLLPS